MSFRLKLSNKLIKNHSKKFFRGKLNFFINDVFFNKLFYKIEHTSKKTRKWIFRRLVRKRLVENYRSLFFKYQVQKNMNYFIDPLIRLFFKFNFVYLVSLNFYKLTDYQLELIRRLARKTFGKKIFINLHIKATFIILRRTNQIRMGGGKGAKLFKKIYFLYPGCSISEIRGITMKFLVKFDNLLKKKLFFKFKLLNLNRI